LPQAQTYLSFVIGETGMDQRYNEEGNIRLLDYRISLAAEDRSSAGIRLFLFIFDGFGKIIIVGKIFDKYRMIGPIRFHLPQGFVDQGKKADIG